MHRSKYTEGNLLENIMLLVSAKRTIPLAAEPHCSVQHLSIHVPAAKHNPGGAGLVLSLFVIPSEGTPRKAPVILETAEYAHICSCLCPDICKAG